MDKTSKTPTEGKFL